MASVWRAVAVLFAIAGCTPSHVSDPMKQKAPDEWKVGCQPDQIDPYGKLIERAKCWSMVSYFASTADGLPIGVATIFEVNSSGARLVRNLAVDENVCGVGKTLRVSVDGKRIDQLSNSEQISSVVNGSRLIREKNRGWPYCNLYNETTTLTGASSAYSEMMRQWGAFSQQ